MRRLRGFTLIEIAVVLGILMVIISLGLTAISAQLSSASYSLTKKRQDAIKDALIGYFGANKSLPCPFFPMPNVPANGLAPVQVAGACPNPLGTMGTVPFATLGLAREIGEDGWGNLFSYQVYADAAPVCPGNGKDWANKECFGAGKSGGQIVNDDAVPLSSNVVAVVISHGSNGLGAWVASQGTRNANPINCQELNNAKIALAGCALVANTFYKGEGQANDDLVSYLTATEVLQPLSKQGSLVSAAAQVNNDLQILSDQTLGIKAAGITVLPPTDPVADDPATTGVNEAAPAYPARPLGCKTSVTAATVANAALTAMIGSMRDPWGNAYTVDDFSSPVTSTINFFPICIYTLGDPNAIPAGVAPTRSNATSCTCVLPTICKSIDLASFNSYLAKAGTPPCSTTSP